VVNRHTAYMDSFFGLSHALMSERDSETK
jgi:hypothetical protein